MFGLSQIMQALSRIEQRQRDAITQRNKLMSAVDDLKTVIEKYIADVNAAVATFQADVQAKVDAAVAAALAGDNTAMAALSAEVAAADLTLPAAPVVPAPPATP